MKAILLPLFALFLLTGCETIYANAIQDYNDGRNLVRNYIGDIAGYRMLVRAGWFDTIKAEVMQREAEGDYAGARRVWACAYFRLVTIDAILEDESKQALENVNSLPTCDLPEPPIEPWPEPPVEPLPGPLPEPE